MKGVSIMRQQNIIFCAVLVFLVCMALSIKLSADTTTAKNEIISTKGLNSKLLVKKDKDQQQNNEQPKGKNENENNREVDKQHPPNENDQDDGISDREVDKQDKTKRKATKKKATKKKATKKKAAKKKASDQNGDQNEPKRGEQYENQTKEKDNIKYKNEELKETQPGAKERANQGTRAPVEVKPVQKKISGTDYVYCGRSGCGGEVTAYKRGQNNWYVNCPKTAKDCPPDECEDCFCGVFKRKKVGGGGKFEFYKEGSENIKQPRILIEPAADAGLHDWFCYCVKE
jgi:outer membrane biosynthesis protein TonB